jgi:DNA-binding transcriptional ArsR family regulator
MLMTANVQAIYLQAKLFRGFSDPSRLSILDALRNGVRTVSDIVQATGLTQSNVSNHLGCLRDCGLVTAHQEGRFVYYALSDERVGQLLRLAHELLADVAKGVYDCTRYHAKESTHGEITNA